MKKLVIIFMALEMFSGVIGGATRASSLPDGDYQRSCEHCNYNDLKLTCFCSTGYNTWKKTILQLSLYEAQELENHNQDIVNSRGDLQLRSSLPKGAYRQVCKDCVYDEKILTLVCNGGCKSKNRQFGSQATLVLSEAEAKDLADGNLTVTTDDGKLVLRPLLKGPYKDSCNDCSYDKNTLTLVCPGGCKDKDGKFGPSTLVTLLEGQLEDVEQGYATIKNENGALVLNDPMPTSLKGQLEDVEQGYTTIINEKGYAIIKNENAALVLNDPMPTSSLEGCQNCTYDGRTVYCPGDCSGKFRGWRGLKTKLTLSLEQKKKIANDGWFIANGDGILELSRPLPISKYQDSCKGCFFDETFRLKCTGGCKIKEGLFGKLTMLQLSESILDDLKKNNSVIDNQNGALVLYKLPKGSYKETCKECSFNQRVLNCLCRKDKSGYWQEENHGGYWVPIKWANTSVEVPSNYGKEIGNRDGNLVLISTREAP